jgi:hypothetical protein
MVKRVTEPHKQPYRHLKYKIAYRISHWRAYEQSLRDRGDIPLWITPEAIAAASFRSSRTAARPTFHHQKRRELTTELSLIPFTPPLKAYLKVRVPSLAYNHVLQCIENRAKTTL